MVLCLRVMLWSLSGPRGQPEGGWTAGAPPTWQEVLSAPEAPGAATCAPAGHRAKDSESSLVDGQVSAV